MTQDEAKALLTDEFPEIAEEYLAEAEDSEGEEYFAKYTPEQLRADATLFRQVAFADSAYRFDESPDDADDD